MTHTFTQYNSCNRSKCLKWHILPSHHRNFCSTIIKAHKHCLATTFPLDNTGQLVVTVVDCVRRRQVGTLHLTNNLKVVVLYAALK